MTEDDCKKIITQLEIAADMNALDEDCKESIVNALKNEAKELRMWCLGGEQELRLNPKCLEYLREFLQKAKSRIEKCNLKQTSLTHK